MPPMYKKIYFIFFLIILVSFIFVNSALATTIEQLVYYAYGFSIVSETNITYQSLGGPTVGDYIPMSAGVQSVSLYLGATSSTDIKLYITMSDGDFWTSTKTINATGWYDFTITGHTSANSIGNIQIWDPDQSGITYNDTLTIYGTTTNTYGTDTTYQNCQNCSTVKDLTFTVNSLQQKTITLDFPVNTSTGVNVSFPNWTVTAEHVYPVETNRYFISVRFGLATGQYYTSADGYPDFNGGTSTEVDIVHSYQFYPGTVYYAIAQIHDSEITTGSNVVATSTEISFTTAGTTTPEALADLESNFPNIVPSTKAYYAPNDPDSFFYVDCSSYGDYVVDTWTGIPFFNTDFGEHLWCDLKQNIFTVLYEIIYPHQLSKEAVKNSIVYLKNGFPFNIVYGALEDIQTSLETTLTPADLDITVAGETMNILTPTLMVDTYGSTFTSNYNQAILDVAWLGAGMFILMTIF